MPIDPAIEDNINSSGDYPPTMMPLKFFSAGYKLLGTFLNAAGEGPHKTVILLHGFPGNETNLDIAHALRRAGWNVLVFHYRGLWGSEGNFSWSNCLDDVHAAIDFIVSKESAERFRVAPNKIVLAGHSMGGFAALRTSADYSELEHAASFAGFNFGYFAKLISVNSEFYDLSLERMQANAEIFSNINPAKLLDEMITCSANFDLINFAGELADKNILFISAKYDTLAPPEIHSLPLINAMKKNGADRLIDLEIDSGHSFSNSRIKLTKMLINWLDKIKFKE
ncbi:MAG: alpha/beta fold hydrolase [Ignavibacteriae bacterium]|nr:alpha/beta fold hydrolase [Ignavibacteriota bacterium]NOG99055.1 alpha/beta fold hydrolase [Ignavibacteriota bacterium]